jgi:molecular chaperone GrpE
MQSGYELLGRLVRPAMVAVAAKDAGAESSKPNGAAPNPYSGGEDPEAGGSIDRRA